MRSCHDSNVLYSFQRLTLIGMEPAALLRDIFFYFIRLERSTSYTRLPRSHSHQHILSILN